MTIVDLTLPVSPEMPVYPSPNHPRVEFAQLGTLEAAGRATRRLTMGSHSGTHVDAPAHFLAGAETVDRLDLGVLMGPAGKVDLRSIGPRQSIERKHLAVLGQRPAPQRLLLHTGWSAHWGRPEYYSDAPYLSLDACDYLAQKGVKLLGIDMASPDLPTQRPGEDGDSPAHKFLFGRNIILVEYLTNLDRISVEDFCIAALPLRLVGCDGSPARVVAFWP